MKDRKRKLVTRRTAISVVAALLTTATAAAVSTRHFTLDSAEALAAGELDGTAAHSDGTVTVGAQVRRIELPSVSVAYSLARADDGTAYIGTGHDGKVFRLRGDALEPFGETGQLMVASLATGPDGTVYAGTLPEGRIYAIDAKGEATELARPEGVEHVWALVWDAQRRRLMAGTGPDGKIFAIDAQGRAEVFHDDEAGHIMALALDGDGTLYAGTSDEARVLRIEGPGRADTAGDFPGNEVTAIDVKDGVLAVAANEFPDPPRVTSSTKKNREPPRPKPGTGRLFRVGTDGRSEKLLENGEGHFTSVQIGRGGAIYAGTGTEGRIVRATVDRRSAVWVDVDERQVLALDLSGERPLFVTGDAGAVYRVVKGPPREAVWTSKVLDAEFQARWGQLEWRAKGKLELESRSGNTRKPDDTWSAWSSGTTTAGPVRSPASRFLQVRARFVDRDAVLRAIQVYYLPQNQRPVVYTVELEGSADASADESIPNPSTIYKLAWKVDNPDSDEVRYRLRFRAEDQERWRDLLREHQILTSRKFAWDTSGVPDGWYVVQVEASDETSNPDGLTLKSHDTSEPFLVDNHAPHIRKLRSRGRTVTGRAVDTMGPIAKLEYAINGKRFHELLPTDHLLDTRDEAFALELPKDLDGGPHIVAIRATDAGGNSVTAETIVTLP